MIRLVYVLRRRQDLSPEDFRAYFRDNRGPLVASHATRLNMRRAVQSYIYEEEGSDAGRKARGKTEPHDAVEEIWFNNIDEANAAYQSTEGKRAAEELLEDERKFVDFSQSSLWFAIENPQINPSPENIVAREQNRVLKTFYPLRHLSRLSLDEAQLYWRMNHGPVIRGQAPSVGILRYIQVHRLPIPLADQLRSQRGNMDEPYTGHAELWSDRGLRAMTSNIPEAALFGKLAMEDEAKFIDWTRSTTFMCKERILVDR